MDQRNHAELFDGTQPGRCSIDKNAKRLPWKRTMDLAGAIGGLVLGWPILAVTAIAVLVTSGSPVLFRQKRVGRHGRHFEILKFRTMTVSSESNRGSFDAGDTSRVTPFGRILRRTKLDELPQVWNVLRGDMSLVGPRPEVPKWVETYPEDWTYILQVRPGITDPASIEFRNEEQILARSDDPEGTYRNTILPRKLTCYRAYVQNWTLANDLKIWWQTVRALTIGKSSQENRH